VTAADGHRLVVERAHVASSHVADDRVVIADGEVLLRVDRLALTSNNVTYAVLGEALRYWQFFPTGDDATGTPPAWGTTTVVASEHGEVAVGERWYGFVPVATHAVVRPGRVDDGGVVDASPHREGLAGAYQRYQRLDADPLHDEATTDLELLHRPLFTTAFLLDDLLADAGAMGAPVRTVVLTSASSKTATALAHLLARRADVVVVGVTSRGNLEAVRELGLHHHVLAYDALADLTTLDGPSVLVDLAGRSDVVAGVHERLGDELVSSLVVGVTHHDATDGAPPPAVGPEPTTFFAPSRASQRARDWGPAELEQRIAEAWRPFVTWVAPRLVVREVDGLAAGAEAWSALVRGDVDPREGVVVLPGA